MRRPSPSCHQLLLPLALLIVTTIAQAQSTGSVTGTVVDAASGAPLAGATAVIRPAADSTATPLGATTDTSGRFTVDHLSIGTRYRLEVRMIGYASVTRDSLTPRADHPSVSLGHIELAQQATEGQEVTVKGQRDQVVVLPDKTVYAVEGNTNYTATNVSELLGQIPSVSVDQDGAVSLRGDNSVVIMINDRPIMMPADQRNKYLQSLPADMVKDIEIRTSPGAQFDAKYQGGIINIVTRRTMSDMLGGSINAGATSVAGYSGGGTFYLNSGSVIASIGGGIHNSPNDGTSSEIRYNYSDSLEYHGIGDGTSESNNSSYYTHGQIDYDITHDDLASLSFSLNHWSSNYSSIDANTYFTQLDVPTTRLFDTSDRIPGSDNSGGYDDASLLLRHTFSDGHKIGLTVTWNDFGYSSDNRYASTYLRPDGSPDDERSSSRNTLFDRSNLSVVTSLDYENQLGKQLKISAGGRNEFNRLDNETAISTLDPASGQFVFDTLQSSHYLPENVVYAGYATVAYRPVDALGIQLGLRLEQAHVSAKYASGAEFVARDYTSLFPNVSLSYTIAEPHSLTLSYRRGIALPDVDALNPTVVKWSDLYSSSGNPDLDPEYTHHVELSYNTYWGRGNMVSVAPFYSTTNGSIERSEQLVNGATYSTYQNFNGTYRIGSDVSLGLRLFDRVMLRTGGSVYRQVNRGSSIPGDVESASTGYNGNVSAAVDLWKGANISFNGYFYEPAGVGGSQPGGFFYGSLGVRQKLLDDNLSIAFALNDPLNLQEWHSIYQTSEFYTESRSKWSSRYVSLNVSYTFGTHPRLENHRQETTETKGGGGGNGGGGGGGGQE